MSHERCHFARPSLSYPLSKLCPHMDPIACSLSSYGTRTSKPCGARMGMHAPSVPWLGEASMLGGGSEKGMGQLGLLFV